MKKYNGKIHYGWIVAFGCCIMMMFSMGVVFNTYSQFIKPICADMGFTRQQMGVSSTIHSVAGIVFSLFWGKIQKSIDIKKWMIGASILMPAFYYCYSFATNLLFYYGIAVLVSVASLFVGNLVMNAIIGNWFIKDRGTAIGVIGMGSGLGGMIFSNVINAMIQAKGWRMTYRMMSPIILFVALPMVLFVIKVTPEEMGLEPYGIEELKEFQSGSGAKIEVPKDGISYEEAIKTPTFWLTALADVGMVMAICMFYQTVSPHLSDSGYSTTFAATVTSISLGCMAAGKVILGKMLDKLGIRKGIMVANLSTFLGTLAMIFCTNKILIPFIFLGTALGCSFGSICTPMSTLKIFGNKDYNNIYGKLSAFVSMGSAAAPIISGWGYDTFGSYIPVYWAGLVVIALSTVLMMTAISKAEAKA